jgi:hypothetical protein
MSGRAINNTQANVVEKGGDDKIGILGPVMLWMEKQVLPPTSRGTTTFYLLTFQPMHIGLFIC